MAPISLTTPAHESGVGHPPGAGAAIGSKEGAVNRIEYEGDKTKVYSTGGHGDTFADVDCSRGPPPSPP